MEKKKLKDKVNETISGRVARLQYGPQGISRHGIHPFYPAPFHIK